MKDTGKILLYLLATVALGALLAPPLFWAGRAVGVSYGIRVFVESDFPRYFNRAILIAALALFWPLAKSLRIGSFSKLGLQPDPQRWQHLAFGLVLAVLTMAGLIAILFGSGLYQFKPDPAPQRLFRVVLSAAGASVIEELLFRGALLGLLRRSLSNYAALFFVSALYSLVHFIQPRGVETPTESVNFLSGFALLPDVFYRFTQPWQVLAGFSTLFVLGWILGYAALKTRALWLSIGIHAGCILGKYGFNEISRRKGEAMPWFGRDLQTGIAPLLILGTMGLCVWAWLKYVSPPVHQSRV